MKLELNTRNIILISIVVILIISFGLLYNAKNPQREEKISTKTVLVSNYSRFFTVSNAANSYINYLAQKDSDSLMKLLDETYQEKHNIKKDNVINSLTNLKQAIYNFEARKMYQENLSKTVIKYYIYGHLRESIMDTYVKPEDYYLILILDTKNFTYSIIPDDGTIFKGVDNNG